MTTKWIIIVFAAASLAAVWALAGSGQYGETSEVPSQVKGDDGTMLTLAVTNEDSVIAIRENNDMAMATFGAGCFWSVEAAFRNTEGVTATAVGYAGGTVDNPTYEEVCSDKTGHAEVVRVEYDPSRVTYDQLLNVFWNAHDPTQVNRQGPDIGYQYRSVIFFHTPEQEAAARNSKEQLDKSETYSRPLATLIEPAPKFWRAEEYHQQYLEKRGLATCRIK